MFSEPLDIFFQLSDFAVAATFGSATINVIFDKEYRDAFAVAGNNPVARCKESDVPSPVGQTLTIAGTVYNIVGTEPDGRGLTLLKLALA